MSVPCKFSSPNGKANFVSAKQFDCKSDETVFFCTKDNLEECLHELSEVMADNLVQLYTDIN